MEAPDMDERDTRICIFRSRSAQVVEPLHLVTGQLSVGWVEARFVSGTILKPECDEYICQTK